MTEEKSAFEVESPEPTKQEESKKTENVEMADPSLFAGNEFKFAQSMAVHSGSVRSLALQGDILMSGSIDMTNKLYLREASGQYQFTREMAYHEGFVMNLCPTVDGTGFFSAGRDNKIILIDLEGNPLMEFKGHEGAVNSVSQAIAGEMVSGSWDGTAKIWDTTTGECKQTLEGHTHAVSVLTLPNGITITGSQDKKIRLWYAGNLQKEFVAHEDIVRGFTEVPDLGGFASISNDEMVKVWGVDGTHMMDLKGHTGFIFACDHLETGEIITGGDDCTVRVWLHGECKQTIQLPKTVWSVSHNRQGDILVGCEDKKIRIFTRDPSRENTGEDFKEYEEECKQGAKNSEMDMNKLLEFSTQVQGKIRGKHDGFVQVFKDKGTAKAYNWSEAESKWVEIGEVCNPGQAAQETGQSSGAGIGKTVQYEGDALFAAGEYDKVIDVDLGDGVYRKLPCNNGANYLETADKFCSREGLSRTYVEQIVQFLRQNTLPYATREIVETGNMTGGAQAAAQNASVNTAQAAKCSAVPYTSHIYYDTAKTEGPKKKILEFNAELNTLTDKDNIYFESLCKVLGAPERFHSSEVSPQQLECLKKLMEWPLDKVFPAIDLYRIYLCHPNSYEAYAGADAGAFFINQLLRYVQGKNAKPVLMLGLRCLCNLFKNQSSKHVALRMRQTILGEVSNHLQHADTNVRQAAITVFLNYSIEFLAKDDQEGRMQCITALSAGLVQEKNVQNLLRSLTALGNLGHKNEECLGMIKSCAAVAPENQWERAANDEKSMQTITDIRGLLGI